MNDYTPKELVTLNVDQLIPYERNPKTHPQSQIQLLANSIREWGWTMPILVSEDYTVIAGHGRLYAAQQLEIESVPCLVAEGWTDEQKSAYVIADNKLSERGEWDMGLYFSELKDLNETGFDMDLMGIQEDLSALNFEPSLNPDIEYSEITESNISSASDAMGRQIQNIGADKEEQGVKVMCPNCAHEFTFTGT